MLKKHLVLLLPNMLSFVVNMWCHMLMAAASWGDWCCPLSSQSSLLSFKKTLQVGMSVFDAGKGASLNSLVGTKIGMLFDRVEVHH